MSLRILLLLTCFFFSRNADAQALDTLATLSAGRWHMVKAEAMGKVNDVPEEMQENMWVEMQRGGTFKSKQLIQETSGTWSYDRKKRILRTKENKENGIKDSDLRIVSLAAKTVVLEALKDGKVAATITFRRR